MRKTPRKKRKETKLHKTRRIRAGGRRGRVNDFPKFEGEEEKSRYVARHNPFTAPAVDDEADMRANARTAVSGGYDMVLNGNEIGGGSIRIHRSSMQSAVFELLGLDAGDAEAKFGLLLTTPRSRHPPHGGTPFGSGPLKRNNVPFRTDKT